ncbi:NADPH-dependent 7-cyano-7-deazaguanine reductase QueF [Rhodoferax sp. TBRC 17198]|jgi:7-cyano-7-deazaguanine reductase|uniref:NADPH-dependent 7-cyano-7-deazaguanine reductase QueF n=1 Tax=Rhodoferax potami TaxID=3068338 RepID=UPI0028BD86DA|nr:NADPH-dependent 7-cyano-7-deazaguanine reductase QueF [Rhodoferax sp. TBRC 17198]MDT7522756.1 NADPH-dependent 7-cyano-7-deazaguanine reductase QueF [Rhodoferax sp. TBRC 17198]
MNTPEQSQLGKSSAYVDQYDASLLFPIPRAGKRAEIGITGAAPFFGADMWTAFELSWLNLRGKPQVALAHFTIPAETPNIIESKSFKLYLNSFNNTRFADASEVLARLRADIAEAAWRGGPVQSVGVRLIAAEQFDREPVYELDGLSLDRLDVECTHYQPAPELLVTAPAAEGIVTEVLVSNLLKSNCLVTGQPDWGSVQISYTGLQIQQEGLLQYLVSFRNHNEFHEQCVERIFMDIWARCKPAKLTVYARYTRRGGLDINPLRTSHPQALPGNTRTARQ